MTRPSSPKSFEVRSLGLDLRRHKMIEALSWDQLNQYVKEENDRVNGPTNSQSNLRLFGKPKSSVEITFYRDIHAWCPYCSKIWLWLETKKIPYRVKKVTMRCYGNKEQWFLKKVPSGMLPALELNGRLITESDEILICLEEKFGALGQSMRSKDALSLRRLERLLFQAWCIWLCTANLNSHQQLQARNQFHEIACRFEDALNETPDPFLRGSSPQTVDLIFIPYIERMNASLAYYKGYRIRKEHPLIDRWLSSLEKLETYRGIQGDFHTHAHDLPPQMGGCWSDENIETKAIAAKIDIGDGLGTDETSFGGDSDEYISQMRTIALTRVYKHRQSIMDANPFGASMIDQPLRAALTSLISCEECLPEANSAGGLRYIRDRISVPRDMPILAARELRKALERTASLDSEKQGVKIPVRNRYDQDPARFYRPS